VRNETDMNARGQKDVGMSELAFNRAVFKSSFSRTHRARFQMGFILYKRNDNSLHVPSTLLLNL
jgi:hypothetical protein